MDLIGAIRAGGDLNTIKRLIEKGVDVNYEDWKGRTALGQAGDLEQVKFLIDNCGANVNYQNKAGHTVLMLAVFNRKIEKIKLLLSRGANVNLESNFGSTALNHAIDDNICNILYWRGAKFGQLYKHNNIDGLLMLIFFGIIPCDLLREIHTKWIS
jgi:hypothetical protein